MKTLTSLSKAELEFMMKGDGALRPVKRQKQQKKQGKTALRQAATQQRKAVHQRRVEEALIEGAKMLRERQLAAGAGVSITTAAGGD